MTTLKGKDSHDCTKSYYLIGYSIRVQSPKVVDMKQKTIKKAQFKAKLIDASRWQATEHAWKRIKIQKPHAEV